MAYAKVDYDSIYSATPVNKTAASVVTAKIPSDTEIEEAYHQFDILNRLIKKATEELSDKGIEFTGVFGKRELLKPYREKLRELSEKRQNHLEKYPFVKNNKGNDLQSFVLDEVKKRLSKSDWDACVRQAQKNMEHFYLTGEVD